MTNKWGRSVMRKMTLSGLLIVLISIRHAVGIYRNDYASKHHQIVHQNSKTTTQHVHLLPHPHRHHHDYMHKNNREAHINSQRSYSYSNEDNRRIPSTAKQSTTATARPIPRTPGTDTVAWKWSSTTASNLRLAELTHQGGNKDTTGSTVFKNRLSDGEKQHWSAYNKQIYIAPFRIKIINSNATSTNMGAIKTISSHVDESSWPHYDNPVHHHDERHTEYKQIHRSLPTKTFSDFLTDKTSHADQRFKSIEDNKDDFDYYYDDDTKAEENVVDSFNFDYLDDEPNADNEDANQNSFKTESLTEEKWKNYGTAEAVEKSRRRYNNEAQSAATAHIQRIKEESKCRWPHPKVIPVTEASKRFVPHCTILHRCGDDTGCCDYDTKTCVAKNVSIVHLHFFVIPLGGSASVEVRPFVNHTECHCVDRCVFSSCTEGGGGNTNNYNGAVASTTSSENETCQCPSHFIIVADEFARGRCRCDCFNGNQACNTLKRGQDGFPAEDQKCISDEKCQMPTCQYGRYSTYTGRCPRVKHQKRTISHYDYR